MGDGFNQIIDCLEVISKLTDEQIINIYGGIENKSQFKITQYNKFIYLINLIESKDEQTKSLIF